jgi:dTDP-4-dehydrorhamnose 3,5-epimerase
MGGVVSRGRIHGVMQQPLGQIEDARGAVLHMLRGDSPLFTRFGEVYFSLVRPRVVKGWKRHRLMTQHFAVPMGQIRLALFDDRPDSPTRGQVEEYVLGRPDHYCLLRIPPLVWYGFQGLGPEEALVANLTDLPHDPAESEGRPLDTAEIPFTW